MGKLAVLYPIGSQSVRHDFRTEQQQSLFKDTISKYGTSLVAQLVKNPPAMQKTWFDSWFRRIHRKGDRLPTPIFLGFPGGSAGKEAACNA